MESLGKRQHIQTVRETRKDVKRKLLYFNNIVNVNRFNKKYKQFLGYQTVNESLQWLKKKDFRYGNNAPYDNVFDENQNAFEIGNPQPSL